MTLTAILLLLVSASAHAGWNLLGKRENPAAAKFLVANTLGSLWLLPALFLYGPALGRFPPAVWVCIGVTGFFQAAYFVALAGAYRVGNLSVVYPLVRSLPIVLVTALTLLLRQGAPLGIGYLAGIALVVAGNFILPMRHFSDLRPANYWNAASLLALLAAGCTVGYSLVDDSALRVLRAALLAPGWPSLTAVTVLYSLVEGWSTSLWLTLFVLALPRERASLRLHFRPAGLFQAILIGTAVYLAYTLVLLAMSFVTNVSYVVAFRQIGVPLGALLGVAVLREPRPAPKFIGVAVMFAGLVLVALG